MRMKIRHNAEIAHRLTKTPGKCQQIHGHGLQIELTFLNLQYDGPTAMLRNNIGEVFEFGSLKRTFRGYIDTKYDHHLLLNESDDFAQGLRVGDSDDAVWLPGLQTFPDDPTVENIAKWIAEWAAETYRCDTICSVAETATNGAGTYVKWNGFGTQVQP